VGAYERLVRAHETAAFRTAFLITQDAGEAEDAAQEAFVKAFYALDRFRAGSPFRPWLLAVVANEAKNRRKAATRRTSLALRIGSEPPAGMPDSPEGAVVASERREELLEALGALREEDRLVIWCRYLLGLSEAETAAVLECARGTVKSRLSRALGRLRERMAGREEDSGVAG
jgi:RNA polymerase sigma-70 factor (ECF subfamily)